MKTTIGLRRLVRASATLRALGCALFLGLGAIGTVSAESIGNHPANFDSHGVLLPWTSWGDAMDREVDWYRHCPVESGYPRFVYMTFMDGNYEPMPKRPSFIPATQNGMGIISYLKYHAWKQKRDGWALKVACYMGDYLVKEASTPDEGFYPRFTRSTGWRAKFPQPPDCGSQDDRAYEVEPDKGGIAGYALVLLWEETKDDRYLAQALQNARVLATNMVPASATNSPWPFRVDYRTGTGRGEVSGNMSFMLRLFDRLIGHGYKEFGGPREKVWRWVKDVQIPNLSKDGLLWVQFFEDHQEPDNRTAWSPLNLARYLLEGREKLDPDWRQDAHALIDFTNGRFTSVRNGILLCGEQTHDLEPWGGILSTYGAVLAMYARATGTSEFKAVAYQALNYSLYAVSDDGCPGHRASNPCRGGWQEDAHTDKLHNVLDAMEAFPEWGK